MNAAECLEREHNLAEFLEASLPLRLVGLEGLGAEVFSIEGYVVFPCMPAGRFGFLKETIGNNPILDIPIMLDGQEIGFFCLSSKLSGAGVEPHTATDIQKHALIKLITADDFDARDIAKFRPAFDCVVVEAEYAESLLRNREASAVWGGFVLCDDALEIERSVEFADSARIFVANLSGPRTNRHRLALQRATESALTVDRFLHLYHFLELDYDHELVERIRAIDLENTVVLEKLLSTGRTELDRLQLVMENFSEFNELESVIGLLGIHGRVAFTVFYDYGKDHNPLKEREAFQLQFIDSPVISRDELDAIKKTHRLKADFTKDDGSYKAMLIKLACYWVYRIRCCIAHNKIGEYHMRTAEDMRFVYEFGELLVRLMISHRLKK